MTRRHQIVLLTAVIAIAAFAAGWFLYDRQVRENQLNAAAAASAALVRAHAPIMGPSNAPVTIVEFFDPSCETCRAFYPVVKQILGMFPNDVRLVIRYAPLHEGSDEVVRMLEAARLQNLLVPVLEGLLQTQPSWAVHGAPRLDIAWAVAADQGLDVERARRDIARPEIDAVLRQDVADLRTANVRGTPTFFVNEKPLLSFGAQQLYDLVRSEVERVRSTR